MANKKILITYDDLTEDHLSQIREVSNNIELRLVKDNKKIPKVGKDAEILFGSIDRDEFKLLDNLEWIQVPSAGVDDQLFPELIESDVTLTTTSGIHRVPMSEISITMMLMFAKKLNEFMHSQTRNEWNKRTPDELEGTYAGILGLGSVGMETAWKAYGLGMKVVGLKKSRINRPSYIEEILGPKDLDYFLEKADYMVITLPLTDETKYMIGERELKLLGNDSYLINVGRGAIVDNEALLEGLQKNWIAGAGLDVFKEEPLPEESKLWDLENVIITPHIAGDNPHYEDRATEIFCKNLKKFLHGTELVNKVDKVSGY